MAQGKAISEEIRNRTVASLLSGRTITETAKQLDLPTSTVFDIKKKIAPELLEGARAKTRQELSDSIVRFLDEGFRTQRNAWRVTENREWLKGQSAGELAIFIGVTSDKMFRILELIEKAIEEANAK